MTSRRRLNRFRTFGYRAGDPWVHNRVVAEARRRKRARMALTLTSMREALLRQAAVQIANCVDEIVLDGILARAQALGLGVPDARELIATHRARGRSWSEVEQFLVEHAVSESRMSAGKLL